MSQFFSSFARASSLARPPSFNDFGGSGLGFDEPRGSMESSASEFSPSSLSGRGSLDARAGLFHTSTSLPSPSGMMYYRRGASLDIPSGSASAASSPTASAAAAAAGAGGAAARSPFPMARHSLDGGGGGRPTTLLHAASMPPPSPSARAAATASAAAAAAAASSGAAVPRSVPKTAPPAAPRRQKILGIDAFEFSDIVRSL